MVYAVSDHSATAIQIVALSIFLVVTVIWAARLAGESIFEEVRENTWDIQKLSSLGPWMMTWGKLLGATIYGWYGGAICLLVFIASPGDLPGRMTIAAICLCAAVLAHSSTLLSALLSIRRPGANKSATGNFVTFVSLVAIATLLVNGQALSENILWYDKQYAFPDFLLYSIFVFALWTTVGAYRLMCSELQVRTAPSVWAGFTVFMGAYAAGFAKPSSTLEPASIVLSVCFGTALTLTYVAVFWDPKNLLVFRQIKLLVQRRNWRRVAEELPAWSVSLTIAVLIAIALLISAEQVPVAEQQSVYLGTFALPLIVLTARDVALLHYFAFSADARRPELAMLVYLALLYWLVPGLLRLLDLQILAKLVLPPVMAQPGFSLLVASAHLILVLWLLRTRWQGRLAQ